METNLVWSVAWVMVASGLSVGLLVGCVARLIAAIPPENRAFKDSPPWGFRVLWWPIQWLAYPIDQAWPSARQKRLAARLQQAGLDYQITPAQFMASRAMAAMAGMGAAWIGLATLDPQGLWEPQTRLGAVWLAAAMGMAYPGLWLRDRLQRRRRELLKTLPFYLDIITLCVEAGLNLQGALVQALHKGPRGVFQEELHRVLRDIRAGQSRADSLRQMAWRLQAPGVNHLVSALTQADSMGLNLGPILRAQAEQRRNERFIRAEKLAMQAPVKMLLPLIAFIFPCTFIVLFFPIAMKFMHLGL
jgi:tight adherence protein C